MSSCKNSRQVWPDPDGQKHRILLRKRPLASGRGPDWGSSLAESSQHTVDQVEPGAAGEPGAEPFTLPFCRGLCSAFS